MAIKITAADGREYTLRHGGDEGDAHAKLLQPRDGSHHEVTDEEGTIGHIRDAAVVSVFRR